VEEKAVVFTGIKSSKSGKKKAKGKKVQVKDGDTLWGIARKHNVCFLLRLPFEEPKSYG